jgi:hypothetical protein
MRRSVSAMCAGAVCLLLAGCAQSGGYSTDAARALQNDVLKVAQSAGAQDYATAQQQLDALQKLNDQELKSGELTQTRHDAIAISIGEVRADLVDLQDHATQQQLQQQLQQEQQQSDAPHPKKHGKGPGPADKGKGGD